MELELALLCAAALLAGFVDAIGGGGGLVTLPALLWAGVPPHLALGTNKGQSVFGSGMALWRYYRAGQFAATPWRSLLVPFAIAAPCAAGGAALALYVDPSELRPVLLAMLVGAGLVILRLRHAGSKRADANELTVEGEAVVRTAPWRLDVVLPAVAGDYDGFFGPGTGTFLLLAYVALANASFLQASASAKVVNFATNLAAVAWFAAHGHVAWRMALPMAAAQMVGSYLGVAWAVRGGSARVRHVVLVVMLLLVARLIYMLF